MIDLTENLKDKFNEIFKSAKPEYCKTCKGEGTCKECKKVIKQAEGNL
jgi:hypothetical protein